MQFKPDFELFFKSSPDLLSIIGFDGFAKAYNRSLLDTLGWSSEEIESINLFTLIHPDDLPKASQEAKRLIETVAQTVNFELRCKCKSGKFVWLSWTAMADKKHKVFYCLARDISEIKRVNELALFGEKSKFEFLTNITHELRTPLNLIMGMTSLLKNTNLTDVQAKYASIISHSSDTLLELINDVLDETKAQSGKMKVKSRPFSLPSLLHNIILPMQISAKQKGLRFSVVIEDSLQNDFWGDELRIKQVLLNLLSNALKFTDSGSITFSARLIDDQTQFEISDTGVGIQNEYLEHIFDRFSQFDNSLSRKHMGTGLGLSICKSLVEKMDGSIETKSIFGKGTTFAVRLPLKTIPQNESSKVYTPISGYKNSLRILLVDDNQDNLFLLQEYLKGIYQKLDLACDGIHALELCKLNNYDLILMDIQMPNLDGLEATKLIRYSSHINYSPVIIAITAYSYKNDRQKIIECGFDDILSKPLLKQSLVELISKHFPDLSDLIPGFIQRRIQDIQKLEVAIQTNDLKTIRTIGHQIAGVAKSYGFEKLTEIGYELEAAAIQNNITKVRSAFHSMKIYDYEHKI